MCKVSQLDYLDLQTNPETGQNDARSWKVDKLPISYLFLSLNGKLILGWYDKNGFGDSWILLIYIAITKKMISLQEKKERFILVHT